MSVRIIGAVCVVAALAGCAKSSDEPPEISPDTMASRGYDAYNRGDYSDAVTYFEDALAVAPDNIFAMQGLAASRDGVLYFGDRRPISRDAAIEEAIYRESLLGHEAYERGDLDEADAQFRAVLQIAPGDRYALKGLEAVRRKMARRESADISITDETVAEIAPTYSDLTEIQTVATDIVPDVAPILSYDAPLTTASDDGAYVSVGSYDSYVATTVITEPVYSTSN